jgi:hypothetical protein
MSVIEDLAKLTDEVVKTNRKNTKKRNPSYKFSQKSDSTRE